MKQLALTTFAIFGVLAVAPFSAHGEANDHLKCLQITGADKLKIGMRIDALDDRFDNGRCKVGRARMLCSPTARTGIEPNPAFEFVEGDEPAGDFVCYTAKCRNRPDAGIATDAFGTRRIGGLQSKLLCVPAGSPTEPAS